MDDIWHLRTEAVQRELLAHEVLPIYGSYQASANPQAIAFGSAQRDLQEVPLREVILINKQRPTPCLAHDQIESAIVSQVARDHTTAVAVAVCAAEITHVEKIARPLKTTRVAGRWDVHVDTIAFKSAEIVSVLDYVPRVSHPELTQSVIDFPGGGNLGASIRRL